MAKAVEKLKKAEKPAEIWKRGVAYIIDAIVVAVAIGMPLNANVKVPGEGAGELYSYFSANPSAATKIMLISLATSLLAILYWAILEYKYKQSLGKYIMKVNIRSTLKELTFWQCFVRNISKVGMLILAIDSLNILLGRSHQRYLEKASNTEVVEKGWKI